MKEIEYSIAKIEALIRKRETSLKRLEASDKVSTRAVKMFKQEITHLTKSLEALYKALESYQLQEYKYNDLQQHTQKCISLLYIYGIAVHLVEQLDVFDFVEGKTRRLTNQELKVIQTNVNNGNYKTDCPLIEYIDELEAINYTNYLNTLNR